MRLCSCCAVARADAKLTSSIFGSSMQTQRAHTHFALQRRGVKEGVSVVASTPTAGSRFDSAFRKWNNFCFLLFFWLHPLCAHTNMAKTTLNSNEVMACMLIKHKISVMLLLCANARWLCQMLAFEVCVLLLCFAAHILHRFPYAPSLWMRVCLCVNYHQKMMVNYRNGFI